MQKWETKEMDRDNTYLIREEHIHEHYIIWIMKDLDSR